MTPPTTPSFLRQLLPVSVFVSGAVVMVLEVLGARFIGPVYGTSLYVWSAIIAVTLLALSLGYWIGGLVADRFPRAEVYFLLFELSALLIVVLPLVREPVLAATMTLGLRAGALAAAILFLGLPLTLLGMLSPFSVRLAAHLIDDLGRITGRLYAVSTAGSLLGTLLAGFYLIPNFHLGSICLGSALVLCAPALAYQGRFARRHLAAAALVLAVGVAIAARPARSTAGLLDLRETHFGQLKVLDGGGARTLLVNGTIQTQTIAGTNVAVTAYAPILAELAWRAKPDARRALLVGLGGGVLPPIFATFGVRTWSVEIDPEMLDVARTYFAFQPQLHPVSIGDGRAALAGGDEKFDFIVLDAFAGEGLPIHLLTEEMMAVVDRRLAKRGVLVLNYLGYREGPRALPLRSVVRTIQTSFPHVLVVPSYPPGDYGNNIVLAAREPIALRGGPRPFAVPPWMESQVVLQPPLDLSGDAVVITDDYNPLDLWAVEGSETWRRAAMAMYPSDVLLSE
ncbi:MAG: hypothetical protein FJ148_12975 [Deltaproteobacteria bacterium]|nr:hypothetical protein [Deltaproteobacteria bacterium]